MNVLTDGLDDPLKPLGVAGGVFLVLAAAGTIAGTPWTTHATMSSAALQVVGSVLMGVVGAALAYVSWNDE
ncbi:hypothetical protein [Haloarcula laminariae]|uniref:hypothetical protein n=1 Tax=Haloarcula laminariae TaxID=2961577 RepID=UPI0021C94BB8|nr:MULTISPECIES: hypothetical protein [Halomicroarcula]